METKTASLPVERLRMSEVSQHKDNPRRHSRQQIEQIAESIEQHGYAKGSMVVQKSSMSLVAGNGVYAALTLLDYDEADFVVVDMDDNEALQFLIRDNRLSELSAWDMPVLNANLSTLKDEGYELEDMVFTMEAMGHIEDDILRRETNALYTEEGEQSVDELWEDMPEFEQENVGYQHIMIHFATAEDVDRFAGLIDQKITEKTKYIWFPKVENIKMSDYKCSDDES